MEGLQELTNALSNGTIPDPLNLEHKLRTPKLGFATPTEKRNLKFRANDC